MPKRKITAKQEGVETAPEIEMVEEQAPTPAPAPSPAPAISAPAPTVTATATAATAPAAPKEDIYLPHFVPMVALKDLVKIAALKFSIVSGKNILNDSNPLTLTNRCKEVVVPVIDPKTGQPLKEKYKTQKGVEKERIVKRKIPISQIPGESKYWEAYKSLDDKMTLMLTDQSMQYLAFYLENDILPEIAQGLATTAWFSTNLLVKGKKDKDKKPIPFELKTITRDGVQPFSVVIRPPRIPAGGVMAPRKITKGAKAGQTTTPKKANAFILANWMGKELFNTMDLAKNLVTPSPAIVKSDIYNIFTGRNASDRWGAKIIKSKNTVFFTPGFLGDFSLIPDGTLEEAINALVPKGTTTDGKSIPLSVSLSGGVSGAPSDPKFKNVEEELDDLKTKWVATADLVATNVTTSNRAGVKKTVKRLTMKPKKGMEAAFDAAKAAYGARHMQVLKDKLATSAGQMVNKMLVDIICMIAKHIQPTAGKTKVQPDDVKKAIVEAEKEFASEMGASGLQQTQASKKELKEIKRKAVVFMTR